ncbi:pectinesterase inhibitor-like [Lycium ferocissimum]|uniref:pectinesterase inhibitor-like n=1 Tax=Lycium ferocissimum TaxID=112874 RepID=UPI0028152DD9|nr:pectinesterase inhibitor-like [Lycium ferocissimum]
MVTSSSSSSLGSTLVLCLIVSSLMTPSTSNPLSQVCIKSKNPRFCLQVFGLNPHRSPYELTQEAIDLALKNASETTKKIHTFLDQTKNDNKKVIYYLCLNYYQSANDVLREAEEYYLKEGPYSNINAAGKLVQEASFHCENEFQKIVGYVDVSTLTKDNENLGIFGSIIVAAADLLSNSTSAKK